MLSETLHVDLKALIVILYNIVYRILNNLL